MTKKQIVNATIAILIICVIYLFPVLSSGINSGLQKTFALLNGEEQPDTNIILIHITANDINNLGDWPLKRSYYALLINNLTKLNVEKIGIEIFLSKKITSQNIYNEVLNNSIKSSGKVVLASIADQIIYRNGKFNATGILYPSPKQEFSRISTGHINFIDHEGIKIPMNIISHNLTERSFTSMLSDSLKSEESLKINFISSWQKFQNYSLLEFFEMLESNDDKLKNFNNKFVLVGVSDPLIAKTISTNFDDEIPGIGLHAFALENLINSRNIDFSYFSMSTYLFFIIVFLSIIILNKSRYYFTVILVSIFIFYILLTQLHVELNYSLLILPLSFILLSNLGFHLFESKQQLSITKSETESLKSDLKWKEQKLNQLKKELLKQSQEPSDILKLKVENLEKEIDNLKAEMEEDEEQYEGDSNVKNFEGIVYKSNKIEKIVEVIKKVAPQKASVLIMGESGSGKELVANAIHNLSERSSANFVAVNCAALPENLLESELFGHVKGAFTGAVTDKMGRFQEADNGTLFLDEIGETSEHFQVKLLRVLQSGDIQKVGSSKTERVNVRIVAATNKNLNELVKAKKFREDLFYRLNVINIELPNLSERREDIEVLADYFAQKEGNGFTVSKAVMNKLVKNEWKGNIRELQSTIKRATIFANSENREIIKLQDLPVELAKYDKTELESLILESLREKEFSHSSINETAKELGGLNRTVISENFRGIFFRIYTENSFDIKSTITKISKTDNQIINNKLASKLNKFLFNIENDLKKHAGLSFEEVKIVFNSKYKNLPQKYHIYLDHIIKNMM